MPAAIPCSVTPTKAVRIQLLSDLAPRGIHDQWPVIAIPEVHRDTSFTVMVRVFGAEGGSVVEDEFRVKVQNSQTPLDLDVTCNVDPYPLPYVEYEGAGPAELTISCGLTSVSGGPTGLVIVCGWGRYTNRSAESNSRYIPKSSDD